MLWRGVPLRLISSGSVFRSKCLSTSDVMYACYFLIKERYIIAKFDEVRFEFVRTLFESLVRGTDTTKSKS